jgi:hypothetical protein
MLESELLLAIANATVVIEDALLTLLATRTVLSDTDKISLAGSLGRIDASRAAATRLLQGK